MNKSLKLIALSMLMFSCTGVGANKAQAQGEQEDTTTHIVTLLIAGDLMQHEPQFRAARQADGTYDYTDVFARVKPEISRADIAIANFEVTLGGPPYKGYPCFSAPDEYLTACVDAGFDVLTTCNNHSCDTRDRGLRRTIELMDKAGVRHLGTYRDQAERDSTYPFIIEKNDIRIAILNFTYGTNGIPVPKPFIVNSIDTVQIARDIKKAQELDPDVIIAIPHWGIEYAQLPNAEQKNLVEWLLRKGVDHVIGGHPHVVQPFEARTIGDERHLVAYSLGNYVSNQSKPNTDGGAMINLTLTKRDGRTDLADCSYSLVWVSRPVISGNKNYRIYPVGWDKSEMNARERSLMQTFTDNTRALFGKHNKGIEERLVSK